METRREIIGSSRLPQKIWHSPQTASDMTKQDDGRTIQASIVTEK